MTREELREKLLKVAKCVYLTCEESVARNISETCLAAAEALAAHDSQARSCPFDAGEPTGWWACSCGAEHHDVAAEQEEGK